MPLRDTVYNGILAKLPHNPSDQEGYFDLLEIWELMGADENSGRDFSVGRLDVLKQEVRKFLTSRESAFFDEPFSDDITATPTLLQAKVTGRLSKILMDRHGFKVSKEGGGLGSNAG